MNATFFAGLATLLILAPLASEDGAWRHEAAVAKIEARNADTPKGAIVFVGSSSIAGWGSLAKDLEGHTVVRRGFGGSNVADQLKAIDRIVVPIAPAVVAYYCGDNDITFEMETVEAPTKIVTRIADKTLPFGGSWTYDLSPDGGGTRLVITENGEVYNPLFRFMSRFVFGHTATIERFLTDLGRAFAGPGGS